MLFGGKVDLSRHKNQDEDTENYLLHRKGFVHVQLIIISGCIMQDQMLGVVLWADIDDRKAVIWCEDHGNLAYYTAAEQNVHEGIDLDAGDLIQFDLREDRDVRRARNLRRVDAGYAPTIVHELRNRGPRGSSTAENVVCFPEARRAG
ncbi:MAG: hypothetical protein CMF72_23310 [Mameliella sp.]|nr:hypothetical protein [Mameliella sp.]|tara:strand:- start:2177 stop:2620 length:444 start_codon:yes stop_codon:yes gene_type:complete